MYLKSVAVARRDDPWTRPIIQHQDGTGTAAHRLSVADPSAGAKRLSYKWFATSSQIRHSWPQITSCCSP